MIKSGIRFRAYGILLFLLALLFLSIPSQTPAEPSIEEFDRYLQACHDVNNFYGAALIGKNGKVLFEHGYGMADIELNVPNTPEMKFQIGSITKQFTATAIMQLAERGLLSVDDPITKYLTDYPSPYWDKITIHNLLTHTSGIPSYTNMPDAMSRRALKISLKDLIALFQNMPLNFEPGTQYSYSNSGYVLLGAIIENVSGMSYEDYLRKNIFDPLGMENSGYCHRDIILKNRACGYAENDDGQLINAEFVHMSTPFSAGALYSTVEDMFIWDQALYTDKILSKASLERMFTPFLDNYGYGWVITEVNGHKLISHGGGIDGFSTSFQRWVDDSTCIVVFSNNENAQPDQIALTLAAIMAGEPYEIPVKKTPIAMAPDQIKEYAGAFKIDDNVYRMITYEEGQLYSQRTGGRRIKIYPEATDKFFYDHDNNVTVRYNRDENGNIISQTIHQNFADSDALKIGGEEAEKVLASVQRAEVDPAVMEKYAGSYQMNPNFILNVLTRENKLFIQAGDNPDLEMTPYSETDFENPDVGVKVSFNMASDGTVTSLDFQQGNVKMSGKKIK